MPVLEIKNLNKMYGGLKAVDDISFSVREGEIVGLLGPNGAGKTSTISMILGLLEADSGSVLVFGKNIATHKSEILGKVNFAAVYAKLPPNMTARQNLTIFSLLYAIPHSRSRVEALIDDFDLSGYADTRSGLLSSGEISRLNLAKALLNEPKLLLLDEPTASLDPSASEVVRKRFQEYVREKRAAILWTSHDMHEIERCATACFFCRMERYYWKATRGNSPGSTKRKIWKSFSSMIMLLAQVNAPVSHEYKHRVIGQMPGLANSAC